MNRNEIAKKLHFFVWKNIITKSVFTYSSKQKEKLVLQLFNVLAEAIVDRWENNILDLNPITINQRIIPKLEVQLTKMRQGFQLLKELVKK
ncbi:MAG: hypothetical protein HQK51_10445 [Oligoflexia bacterium]|nr:hypothetical protein [Oligoflexia bacterium]